MKIPKMLLMAGAAGLMSAAVPAPANASFWCWFGKCGGSSTGGGTGGSTGGSSGGTPTPVPEPEQMALFGMGAAVLAGRMFLAGRKRK
ncbi:PEP-CTERM sorting domain-containing protein [Sphingobium cupriresistens]|uniref:PEP-CTERM sorting domain-containing protein n=1 Tax=Sphingobium cupriresistens TaxID=1132417 RepID=A0A8G1ZHG2_9SPHN|nr:PEP-CTERM sorting domain-containing protein [Sphingobium cupriresistens]RYM12847.1 PEP-CTERM sorting domain-containing protein [Sphingobium cupriresistens]